MIHVYGAKTINDPVVIIGDKKALKKLIETLQDALENKVSECDCKTLNNEEYKIHCLLSGEEQMEELLPPYDTDWIDKNVPQKILDSSKSARTFIIDLKEKQ
jgi:hypothetical protein